MSSDGAQVILDADARHDRHRAGSKRHSPPWQRGWRRTGSAARRRPQAAHADCLMADGTRIEIFANLGSTDDAARAVAAGAEGCGLLRTEFLFLDRAAAPSEEEQRAAYAAIAEALGGRPLIVRTLDIGGDKPVPYLPFPPEDNPALGAARHPAGAGAARSARDAVPRDPDGRARGAVPHHAADDRRSSANSSVRARCSTRRRARLGRSRAPFGVMIETPAAALLARRYRRRGRFPVGRHQRPDPICPGRRSRQSGAAPIGSTHCIRRCCG